MVFSLQENYILVSNNDFQFIELKEWLDKNSKKN